MAPLPRRRESGTRRAARRLPTISSGTDGAYPVGVRGSGTSANNDSGVKTCREPRYYNSSRCHRSGSRRGGTGKLTSMNGCNTKRLSQKSRSSITDSQGPLSEPRRAVQPYRQQPLNLPQKRPCRRDRGTAQSGGERPSGAVQKSRFLPPRAEAREGGQWVVKLKIENPSP